MRSKTNNHTEKKNKGDDNNKYTNKEKYCVIADRKNVSGN